MSDVGHGRRTALERYSPKYAKRSIERRMTTSKNKIEATKRQLEIAEAEMAIYKEVKTLMENDTDDN